MKKSLFITLIFFFLFLFNFQFAYSQWTNTNGPYGGTIQSIVTISNYIFIGTQGIGVYVSTNNGTIWTPSNNGLSATNILTLAVSGNNLFAGAVRLSIGIYNTKEEIDELVKMLKIISEKKWKANYNNLDSNATCKEIVASLI